MKLRSGQSGTPLDTKEMITRSNPNGGPAIRKGCEEIMKAPSVARLTAVSARPVLGG